MRRFQESILACFLVLLVTAPITACLDHSITGTIIEDEGNNNGGFDDDDESAAADDDDSSTDGHSELPGTVEIHFYLSPDSELEPEPGWAAVAIGVGCPIDGDLGYSSSVVPTETVILGNIDITNINHAYIADLSEREYYAWVWFSENEPIDNIPNVGDLTSSVTSQVPPYENVGPGCTEVVASHGQVEDVILVLEDRIQRIN